MVKSKSKANTKKRPKLFRALGDSDPPDAIDVNYRAYHRVKIIKHDSWAATALYESAGPGTAHQIICKFNRTQAIGIMPMRWLGRRLARRESRMYLLLHDVPSISTGYDKVYVAGSVLPHACAHEFIEGHPLRWHDKVNDHFFQKLESTLKELHRRNIAYVDMNKSENVIVDENGNPCLIDFQISVRWTSFWLRGLLRLLQQSDLYHCAKMKRRFRPDLVEDTDAVEAKPWWIRAHRRIATPFRAMRRRLLVVLGIRKGYGKPQSEAFIEEALRAAPAAKAAEPNRAEPTSVEQKPILRMYQLLRSPRYAGRFDSKIAYSKQLFADLLDGRPLPAYYVKQIKRYQHLSEHDKVVDLLKSKVFYEASNRWDRDWLERKIRSIESKIARQVSSSESAGDQAMVVREAA